MSDSVYALVALAVEQAYDLFDLACAFGLTDKQLPQGWATTISVLSLSALIVMIVAAFQVRRILLDVYCGRVQVSGLWTLLLGVFYLQHKINKLPPVAPYCRGCGYDLTGNTSGTCPECGTKTSGPDTAAEADLVQREYGIEEMPGALWVTILLLGAGMLLRTYFAAVRSEPGLLFDVAVTIALIVGLVNGHRWAYVLITMNTIFTVIYAIPQGHGRVIVVIIIKSLMLVPVLVHSDYFWQRASPRRVAGQRERTP